MLNAPTVGFGEVDIVQIFQSKGAQTEVFVADLQILLRRLRMTAVHQHQYRGRHQTLNADPRGPHQRVDPDRNAQLLPEFPLQAILDRLVAAELATGQVPFTTLVLYQYDLTVDQANALYRDGKAVGEQVGR